MGTPRTTKIFALHEDLVEKLTALTEHVAASEEAQIYRGSKERLRIHRHVSTAEIAECGGDKALIEEIRTRRASEAEKAEAVLYFVTPS